MRRSTIGPDSATLSCVLLQALQLTGVGLSGVALAGCGPNTDAEGYLITNTASGTVASKPGFDETACGQVPPFADGPVYIRDLEPADPVDAIELWDAERLAGTGEPCSEAADPTSCKNRYFSLSRYPAFTLGQTGQIDPQYHLRATHADEVLRVGTPAELQAFLGAIDSRGDAQLWVSAQQYSLLCGTSGARPVDNGNEVLAFTYQGCDGRTRHLLHVAPDGTLSTVDRFVEREPDPNCVVGRRPEGLRHLRGDQRASLGNFFAHSAALEAASVPAFLRLARELQAHGAPPALARRAVDSARDEVRHTRAVDALARRFGAKTPPFSLPPARVRGLEAVATDNAVEGCVRETYGALVAHHQLRRAEEARVRAVYQRIATDETRHAELSWAVARWAESRLTATERRRVQAARSAAAAELIGQVRGSRATAHDALAGLPSPGVGAALAVQLDRALWRRA